MERKIDEIREHIYEIKIDLKEHMARTEQNEEMISLLRKEVNAEKQLTDPVKRAYIGAKWSISAIVVLSTIAGTVYKFFV
jgi:hypothetical protein